jgi:hypothetical protein
VRKDRVVVEVFLHERTIDRATYERQVEKLDADLLMAEVSLHEARLGEIDIEGVVGFAEHLLAGAGTGVWLVPHAWIRKMPRMGAYG